MITLLDGSCGSFLWDLAEERGIEKLPPWLYSIEQPGIVLEMHKRYVEAGSRMIQTNTFSLNRDSLARKPVCSMEQLVKAAVSLAKQATEGTGVKVYLSSGPLTRLLEPYGNLKKEECAEIYREIFTPAVEAGADAIMLETFMDIEMMKIAASEAKKYGVPVICSMTFEKRRRTMMGNTVEQICKALEPLGIDAIGMNCSKGPVEGLEIIKEFSEKTSLPLYFKPNSGLGESYGPEDFARELEPAIPFVSYIGGCCGCNDAYIKALKALIS